MPLQEIKSKIDERVKKHAALVLDESGLDGAVLGKILENVPGRQLVIHQPEVSDIRNQGFSISGRCEATWPLVGLPSSPLQLEAITVELSESNGSLDAACRLAGTLGAARLPVSVQPDPAGGWSLTLSEDGHGSQTIAHLLPLALGGMDIGGLEHLLADDTFQTAAIDSFDIRFDARRAKPTYSTLQVGLPRPWEIAPGILAIQPGCRAEFYTVHVPVSGDLALTSIGGAINGSFVLGGKTFDIEIRLGDSELCEIEIKPEAEFPAAADLASLAGGPALGQLVHNSLSAWGFDAFRISRTAIGFDPVDKSIAYVTVDGHLTIAQTAFDLSLWLPEFGLAGRLTEGEHLTLGQLLERVAIPGANLPDVTISDLVLSADPKNNTYALQVRVDDPLQLAPAAGLPTLSIQEVELELAIDPAGGGTGRFRGIADIAGVEVELSGALTESLALSGTIPRLRLTGLFDALLAKARLPADLPDVEFSDLQFSLSPATGALVLRGRADGRWKFPSSDSGLVVSRIDVALDRTVEESRTATAIKITISGEDAAPVAEGLTIQNFSLAFSLDRDGQWSLTGDVHAMLFDTGITLNAGYAEAADMKVIRLSGAGTQSLTVLDLAGICRLDISHLTVEIGKNAADGQPDAATFDVAADGRIAVAGAFDFSGRLTLYHRAGDAAGLAFQPDRAVATIPLAGQIAEGAPPTVEIEIGEFTVGRRKPPGGSGKSWILEASATAQLQHIPTVVQNYLPREKLSGRFCADGQTVVLHLTWPSVAQPRFPEVALELTDAQRLSLGRPALEVKEIEVALGAEARFIQKMTVSSIGGFNKILGVDTSGRANYDFLNDRFDIDLTIARKPGIMLRSSPFRPLKLYEKDGRIGWDLDLGDYGLFHVQIPAFSFAGGCWEASGGLQVEGDVKLPLGPLKFILRQAGLPDDIVDFMPAAIALKDVNLADERYLEDLRQVLGSNTGEFVDRLFDVLQQLQRQFNQMPDDFIEYADLHLPRAIALDIGMNPAGSFHFKLSTGDGRPLRVMLPMLGPLPGLMGVTVYRLAAGMTSGGALVLLEIDGNIDFFDLPAITAALADPQQTRHLRNRIICRDTLAVLPTAAPAPMPLFYSQLAWELNNILGMQIGLHWSFPQPEGGLFAFIGLFDRLRQFFCDPGYLLHTQGFPAGLQLKLAIGPNFLSLPPYLGGGILGLQEDLDPLDVDECIALLLDAFKTGNPGYLIQAIPLKVGDRWIRVGDQAIRFGPLSLSAAWCITTEEEFVRYVLPETQQANKLPPAISEGVLDALPAKRAETAPDGGFIVLLMGGAGMGPFKAQTQFGLAVTRSAGFETGFRLHMDAGIVALTLGGRIQADGKKVAVDGQLALTLTDRTLIDFAGRIAVSETAFEAAVSMTVTPVFKITGILTIGQNGVALGGTIGWEYGPQDAMTCRGTALFSDEGMKLSGVGEIFGVAATFRVTAPGEIGGSGFSSRIELDLPDFRRQFDQLLKADAQAARREIDRAGRDLSGALDGLQEVDWNVDSLRNTLITVCDTAIAETETRVGKLPTRFYKTVSVTILGKKIEKRVRVPGVNPREEARKKAPASIERVKRLKAAAATDDRQKLAAAISQALDELVRHKSLTVYGRTVTVISAATVTQIETVRDNIHSWVNLLPERESGVRLSEEKLAELKNGVNGALGEIGEAIEQEMLAGVPRLTAVWFESDLQSIRKTSQIVRVNIQRSSQAPPREYHIDLDFTDPARSTAGLYKLFRDGYIFSCETW